MTRAIYQQVPVESFAEVLLRTGKLAEAKTEVFPTTEGKSYFLKMLRNSKRSIKLKREVGGKKTNKLSLVNLHISIFSKTSNQQYVTK